MTDKINFTIDSNALTEGVREAGAEVERIAREEISPAAALIEDAFERTASSIQRSLSRAARGGSLSLKSLADSILRDLKRLAIDSLVRKPIQNLLTSALTGATGGRAGGGFVQGGQSYLVGERGPEVFTPGGAGHVSPTGGPGAGRGVTVNISLPGVSDAGSFKRSETQIAAGLARAIGRGQRNL